MARREEVRHQVTDFYTFPYNSLTREHFKQMFNHEHKIFFTGHGMFGIVGYLSSGQLSRDQEDSWVVWLSTVKLLHVYIAGSRSAWTPAGPQSLSLESCTAADQPPACTGAWGIFCHLHLLNLGRFLTGQHSSLSRLNLLQWSVLPVLHHLQTFWDALCPFIQVINEVIKQYFSQCWSLGGTKSDWSLCCWSETSELSSSASFQSTSHIYVSSLYFINLCHKNGMGNSVKSLAKIKINNTHCSPRLSS